jgi:hypothetical protein
VIITGLKYARSTCEADCMDQAGSCIKFGSITVIHQKEENILTGPMATTYTFIGADFKTFKCDDRMTSQ